MRAKHLKDEELLLPPGELKLDEKLSENIGRLTKFSVRLGGGLSFLSGGNYNQAAKGMNAYRQAVLPGSQGTIDGLGFGGSAFFEGTYWFKPNMGIGLAVGYYQSKIDANAFSYDDGANRVDDTVTTSLDIFPVAVYFHYGRRMCERVFLDFHIGPGIYFGCFRFSKIYQYDQDHLNGTFDFNGQTTALGLQGGIGLDYRLSDRISLSVQLTGRLASLSGLKDEWSVKQSSVLGPYEGSGTDYKFWVFDRVDNGLTYKTWDFGPAMPSGSDVRNAREGSVGGSAVGLSLGLSYRF